MKYYLVKLSFTTPVRFGADEMAIGVEKAQPYLHSDTLFSALCNAWIKFGIFSGEDLSKVKEHILLSSTSFYSSNSEIGFFLPKPKIPCAWLHSLKHKDKAKIEKLIKQAQWIPLQMFKNWLIHTPEEGVFSKDETELRKKLDYGQLFEENIIAKHSQDRLTAASNIFYQSQQTFIENKNAGLYFFVGLDENQKDIKNIKDKFNKGLLSLNRLGLGGERNMGLGRFRVDSDSKNGILISIEQNSPFYFLFGTSLHYQCSLSLSYPSNDEIEILKTSNEDFYHDLILRKGWTFSTQNFFQMKRQTVSMFSEGSVFEHSIAPKGITINLSPPDFPHPIYRFGKTFLVTIPEPYKNLQLNKSKGKGKKK